MEVKQGENFKKEIIRLDDGRTLIYYDFTPESSNDAVHPSREKGEK